MSTNLLIRTALRGGIFAMALAGVLGMDRDEIVLLAMPASILTALWAFKAFER